MVRLSLAAIVLLGWCGRGVTADPPSLDGVWEITALIDDGEAVPAAKIREGLAKDGRLTISGQSIKLVRPRNNETVTILFVADTKVNPATVELAGTDKIGSKGIIDFGRDTATLCVSEPGIDVRPHEFISKEGSHTILMHLKRTNNGSNASVVAIPANNVSDDVSKKMLIGTWGHQDDEKVELGTFSPDGSFSMTKTWKKGWRKLIESDSRSSGEWSVRDGALVVKITASTDKEIQGQVFSYKINSITDRDLMLQGPDGKTRREWKTGK